MRFGFAMVVAVTLAGCGGGIEDQISGRWHVDPSSIQTGHLAGGASTNPEWVDATKEISKLEVEFKKDAHTVTVTGLGQTSKANWSVKGSVLRIDGGNEFWPAMTYDPRGPRIHMTLARAGDLVQMDLIKG